MNLPRIAVDAMGGDVGVRVMIEGAALARRNHEQFQFLLFGDETQINAALAQHPRLAAASKVVHAPDVIAGEDKPSQALRRAKTTSMGMAIDAVKRGEAGAAVSAGNTGALMAISKLSLRTLPGIDRPALAALLPTLGTNDLVMLDLGANTEADARNLVQFAVMGAAYSRIVTGLDAPRVRLLNIGTEEIKGTDDLRVAANRLKEAADQLALSFEGFTEADKLCRGDVDVAVTDGQQHVMLFSNAGKSVCFAEDDVRVMGRGATGVRGMTLLDDQEIIALIIGTEGSVLNITENGYGKRTALSDFPRHRRGGQGVIAIQTNERNGAVVAAVLVADHDEIMLITDAGTLVRTRVEEIRELRRNTQGVTVIKLSAGEKVVGVDRIPFLEGEDGDLIDDEPMEEGGEGIGDPGAAPV